MHHFVATDVYALQIQSFKKNCNIHVQNEGGVGGSTAFWTMLKKTALLVQQGFPKGWFNRYQSNAQLRSAHEHIVIWYLFWLHGALSSIGVNVHNNNNLKLPDTRDRMKFQSEDKSQCALFQNIPYQEKQHVGASWHLQWRQSRKIIILK